MKLSIKWKISLALLALFMCVSSNFFGIHLWLDDSKSYGTIINLAGRQRMLSQKMTKEAMFIVNGFDVREDLEETKQLFENTLNGLIYGDEKLGLPPANVREIREQLLKVKRLWGKLRKDIDTALNGELNLVSKKRVLYESSLEVLREMNTGVEMLEEDSSRALSRLGTNATLTFIFSIFIAAGGFYYIGKNVISKLRETVDAAKQLKEGDLSVRLNASSQDEIGTLGSAFNEMAIALEKRQEQEKMFQWRMQEETVLVQEQERRRISQEIHDQIGHSLAIVSIKMQEIKSKLPERTEVIKDSIESTITLIKEMIQQTRSLIFDLYPVMLDDFGIIKTIESHVHDFALKTGLKVDFIVEGSPGEPHKTASLYIFRVVKELLNNSLKHSNGGDITVEAFGSSDIFGLSVEDNGKGFDLSDFSSDYKGIGLVSIRERVKMLRGTFNIDSVQGQGTRIEIEIPVKKI